MHDAKPALEKKGFVVVLETTMAKFISRLPNADVAWVISGMNGSVTGPVKEFTEAVVKFHKRGGGLLVWGDNDPYYAHANVLLPELLKERVQLIGNTPGGYPMGVGKPTQKGSFGPHIITTGVIKLFEGITICYPDKLGPLKVLATSSNDHPAVCYADNESLKNETCGRIIVDCGWTKMYCSWKEAGTARYITNATIWLLGLEHKLENQSEEGEQPVPETVTEGPVPDSMKSKEKKKKSKKMKENKKEEEKTEDVKKEEKEEEKKEEKEEVVKEVKTEEVKEVKTEEVKVEKKGLMRRASLLITKKLFS